MKTEKSLKSKKTGGKTIKPDCPAPQASSERVLAYPTHKSLSKNLPYGHNPYTNLIYERVIAVIAKLAITITAITVIDHSDHGDRCDRS